MRFLYKKEDWKLAIHSNLHNNSSTVSWFYDVLSSRAPCLCTSRIIYLCQWPEVCMTFIIKSDVIKMSLTVVNYFSFISQSWTGRSASVKISFLQFLPCIHVPQNVAFSRATFICNSVNSNTFLSMIASYKVRPTAKNLPFKFHAIYNILKFRLTLDMMSLEKNAKDLKLLTGDYLIKTQKGSMHQKHIGQSENK